MRSNREVDSPSEEEVREVFARYGLTMYKSQCLERNMISYLALSSLPAVTHRYAIDDRFAEHQRATFTQLVDRLSPLLEDAELKNELTALAEVRNRIAHSYFWEMAAALTRSDGCNRMVKDLSLLADRFGLADERLSVGTRRLLQARGVSASMLEAEMEGLRLEPESSPPEAVVPKQIRVLRLLAWRPRGKDGAAFVPVMVTDTGEYLILGDRGLCLGPAVIPDSELSETSVPAGAFPASVKPRPRGAAAWRYTIALSGNYELRVSPGEGSGLAYRFEIHRPIRTGSDL
jgi:hypothetical protein